jgi:hypothetical protein
MGAIEILRRLKPLHAPAPLLTVYLGYADKRSPHAGYFVSQLHSNITHALTPGEKTYWKKDIDRMVLYLNESYSGHNARSLVFVAGKDVWEVLEFDFFLPPLAIVLHVAYLKPVEDAIATYQHYLILLVDREKARFFTVHLGEITEHKGIDGSFVPQRVKHGSDTWDPQDKINRHIGDHLHRHLSRVAKAAADVVYKKNIHFVLLGGQRDLFAQVKSLLPTDIQHKIKTQYPSEMSVSGREVLDKSIKILEDLEETREQKRLDAGLRHSRRQEL